MSPARMDPGSSSSGRVLVLARPFQKFRSVTARGRCSGRWGGTQGLDVVDPVGSVPSGRAGQPVLQEVEDGIERGAGFGFDADELRDFQDMADGGTPGTVR